MNCKPRELYVKKPLWTPEKLPLSRIKCYKLKAEPESAGMNMGFDEGLRIYCCYYQVVLSDMQNNSFCEGMFSKEERFKIS